MRVLVFGLVGIAAGALAGVILASQLNTNCDQLLELAAGCTRYKPGILALYGAVVGFALGVLVAAVTRRRP